MECILKMAYKDVPWKGSFKHFRKQKGKWGLPATWNITKGCLYAVSINWLSCMSLVVCRHMWQEITSNLIFKVLILKFCADMILITVQRLLLRYVVCNEYICFYVVEVRHERLLTFWTKEKLIIYTRIKLF